MNLLIISWNTWNDVMWYNKLVWYFWMDLWFMVTIKEAGQMTRHFLQKKLLSCYVQSTLHKSFPAAWCLHLRVTNNAIEKFWQGFKQALSFGYYWECVGQVKVLASVQCSWEETCDLAKQNIKGNFPMTHKIVLVLSIEIKSKQLAELITWIWKVFRGSDDNLGLRKDWKQTIRYFVNSVFWHEEFWF